MPTASETDATHLVEDGYHTLNDDNHQTQDVPSETQDVPSEIQAALKTFRKEASDKMAYVLPLQYFVALFGSSAVATTFLMTEETDLDSAAVLERLLVPSFVGSSLFALTVQLETMYHRRLTQDIIKTHYDANGDVDVAGVLSSIHDPVPEDDTWTDQRDPLIALASQTNAANDLYRSAVIVGVGGLLFSALGLSSVATTKLGSLVTDETNSIAVTYTADAIFHAAVGVSFPIILGKCGLELPENSMLINAVALAAAVLAEAILEFGLGKMVTDPYLANAIVACIVSLAAAVVIKSLDMLYQKIPGESVNEQMGSFSGSISSPHENDLLKELLSARSSDSNSANSV